MSMDSSRVAPARRGHLMSRDSRPGSGWIVPVARRRSWAFRGAAGLVIVAGAALLALVAYTVFILLVVGW